jgi:hypothetical protein
LVIAVTISLPWYATLQLVITFLPCGVAVEISAAAYPEVLWAAVVFKARGLEFIYITFFPCLTISI